MLVFAFYKIVIIENKKEVKEFIKIMLTRLISAIIPVLLFGIYLFASGIWNDFLEYAIFGVKTFTNKVFYFALFKENNYFIRIFAALVPLQIIIMLAIYLSSYKYKEIDKKEWFKNIFLLLIYSVASTAVMIPIADKGHFATGSIITIIAIVYLLNILIREKLKIKYKENIKNGIEIIAKIVIIIAILYSIYLVITGSIQ